MKLNKNSWHYKVWSGSFDRYEGAPDSTDLCRYCHRIFWRLAYLSFVIGVSLWVLGGSLWLIIYKGFILNTMITLVATAIIVAITTVVVLYARWISVERQVSEPTTLVGKWAQATKQGVCPMVEFTDSTKASIKNDSQLH